MSLASKFLDEMNSRYLKLHKGYEDLFWITGMGDQSAGPKMEKALQKLDDFRSSESLKQEAILLRDKATAKQKTRLDYWIGFFDQYQMPTEAKKIKKEISALENTIRMNIANRKEGYIDPKSKKFVIASSLKLRTMLQTHPDEKIRKACYQAREKLALQNLDEYIVLVGLRNKFAHTLGYEDFYDYKLRSVDKMTKSELFSLFDDIYQNNGTYLSTIREMEKNKPGLRKPWNFMYFTSGDFTKEEDQYFQFDQAVDRWGRSFSALGINFQDGRITLDLLDRKGKYNNGFCHWPDLVHFEGGKRIPGAANFTCNVVAGQAGSGVTGYQTLFHEGGHAAHLLNVETEDVCLHHEYAPMTASWAETQSMFIDAIFDSIEWKNRYAKNVAGEAYPLDLFKKKVEKLNVLKPARMFSLIFVCSFEREIYESKNLTRKKVIDLAKKNHRKYFDLSEDSLLALNIPHLYSWDSSCSYHGYGLAQIALTQWRHYFYKKYGYIVDNPNVGKEMKKVWALGSSKSFNESVKIATGQKLSSKPLIKTLKLNTAEALKLAKKRLKVMEGISSNNKPVDLKADIRLVHGKKVVTNNKISFGKMAEQYETWVKKMALEN